MIPSTPRSYIKFQSWGIPNAHKRDQKSKIIVTSGRPHNSAKSTVNKLRICTSTCARLFQGEQVEMWLGRHMYITVLQCALMFSMHGPRLVLWAMLMLLVAAFLWLCHSYSSNSAKGYSKNKPHKPVPSADYSHGKGPEFALAEFPPPHHSSAEWGKLVGMGWKEVGIFTPQVPTTKPAFPRHITGDQLKAKAICIDTLCLCTTFWICPTSLEEAEKNTLAYHLERNTGQGIFAALLPSFL